MLALFTRPSKDYILVYACGACSPLWVPPECLKKLGPHIWRLAGTRGTARGKTKLNLFAHTLTYYLTFLKRNLVSNSQSSWLLEVSCWLLKFLPLKVGGGNNFRGSKMMWSYRCLHLSTWGNWWPCWHWLWSKVVNVSCFKKVFPLAFTCGACCPLGSPWMSQKAWSTQMTPNRHKGKHRPQSSLVAHQINVTCGVRKSLKLCEMAENSKITGKPEPVFRSANWIKRFPLEENVHCGEKSNEFVQMKLRISHLENWEHLLVKCTQMAFSSNVGPGSPWNCPRGRKLIKHA